MRKYITLVFFLLLNICALAQIKSESDSRDSIKARSLRRYPKPSFILLMLHVSTNKIEALKKRGLEKDIPTVMEADAEINNSIIKDFSENFTFCPVYFFYDTCYEKAQKKQWADITFYDYESLHLKKMVGANSFSNYYFAEVGYRSPGEQLETDNSISERMVDRYKGDEDAVSTRNYGINLYDEDFKPIKGNFGFVDISLRRKGELFGPKKFVFVGASKFEKKMRLRYDTPAKE